MNKRTRRFLKRLISSQRINHLALYTIKALAAAHLPFPYKGMIHRFPLKHVSIPFEVKLTDTLSLKFMNLGNSSIENLLYFFGIKGYEPEMLPIIFTLAKRVSCFLDVGTNNGHYSLIVSALNSNCSVFAFEPSPINIEWCLRNIEINKFTNCHLIPKAISNYNGKIKLLDYDSDSSPTIISSGLSIGEKNIIEVDVTTIDTFIEGKNLRSVDLVKVDVEMAEPYVLEGMRNSLKRHAPVVILEVLGHADVASIRNIFSEYGYKAYHIGYEGRLKFNHELDRSGTGNMRNFLFTNKELADIGLSKLAVE